MLEAYSQSVVEKYSLYTNIKTLGFATFLSTVNRFFFLFRVPSMGIMSE
jgi:hypothetical protein